MRRLKPLVEFLFWGILFSELLIHLATTEEVAKAKEYQTVGLDVHNKFRSTHQVPPLTLNETLNEMAVKCAEYYVNERKEIDHTCPYKTGGMGENLFSSTGRWNSDEEIAELAVKLWYEEIKDYRYSNPKKSNFSATGHFTQLVWKGSKELGFGIAFRNERSEYIVAVALYTPPGNLQDQQDWKDYKENVLRSIAGSRGAGLVKEDSGASGLAKGGVIIVQMACLAVAVSGTFVWF